MFWRVSFSAFALHPPFKTMLRYQFCEILSGCAGFRLGRPRPRSERRAPCGWYNIETKFNNYIAADAEEGGVIGQSPGHDIKTLKIGCETVPSP